MQECGRTGRHVPESRPTLTALPWIHARQPCSTASPSRSLAASASSGSARVGEVAGMPGQHQGSEWVGDSPGPYARRSGLGYCKVRAVPLTRGCDPDSCKFTSDRIGIYSWAIGPSVAN